jgi:hypothetical protein
MFFFLPSLRLFFSELKQVLNEKLNAMYQVEKQALVHGVYYRVRQKSVGNKLGLGGWQIGIWILAPIITSKLLP